MGDLLKVSIPGPPGEKREQSECGRSMFDDDRLNTRPAGGKAGGRALRAGRQMVGTTARSSQALIAYQFLAATRIKRETKHQGSIGPGDAFSHPL